MNQKVLKIVVPVVAVAVIVESLLLFTKSSSKTGPVALPTSTTDTSQITGQQQPTTLKWTVDTTQVKTGETAELPLVLTSDKDVAIDAVDLYVNYDPKLVSVTSAGTNKSFVAPSFKKISEEKGVVVMNFLVSEASGFKLKAGVPVEITRLSVNYKEEGMVEFSLGEGTLVVENATAKVLPFNSEKLVINVSR